MSLKQIQRPNMPTLNFVARATALLALFAVLSAPIVLAQQGPNPERMKERMQTNHEKLIKVLAMSEEQDAIVRPILVASLEKRTELMEDAFGDGFNRDKMMAMRTKTAKIDEETKEELAEVLSEDQINAYDEFQKENARFRGRRRGGQQQL